MLVWPYSFAIYYYGIYQSNRYNGLVFTVRARALNTLLNGFASVLAGWSMAYITDKLPLSRRHRAYVGLAFNFILVNAVWIGGYFAMIETVAGLPESKRLDVFSSGYGAKAFLFVMYGYMDGCYVTYLSWFFGALSNDVKVVSRITPLDGLDI
jgi:hypothetical protein